MPLGIGAYPSTTLCRSTEMARPERPRSEARNAQKGRVLGEEGIFPSLPARDYGGGRCKLPQ